MHCLTLLARQGDFWGGDSADILLDKKPVARISRKLLSARELFLDAQTCKSTRLFSDASRVCLTPWIADFLTVAPGVDVALVVAICLCFDEFQH